MTIHIELNPEMEARMAAEALASGVPLESYATNLIEEALARKEAHRLRASQEEFRSFLDALAGDGSSASSIRNETFSREMIYGEHD